MAATPVQPADVLEDLMSYVPELSSFANLEVKVPFNVDSSRVGPKEWTILAKLLHKNRAKYDAFLVRAAATARTALSSLFVRVGGLGG
jgi:L-asparaginase/Glu-tRNA(Gln) amidotransferase subunit D